MKKAEVLSILERNQQALKAKAVRSLGLFGSVARDAAMDASDVDLLVEFQEGHPTGLFEFLAVKHFLEDTLGCRVDLVMADSLREELREQVLREAIRAA